MLHARTAGGRTRKPGNISTSAKWLDSGLGAWHRPAVFAAFLCTILFSVSSVCGHRSARLIGGTEANFWRLSIAVALLAAWSFTMGIGLSGPALPVLAISGAIGIGIGDVALFQALPRLGPRVCSLLIQCITAPLGAFIEWTWLGTPLSGSQIASGLVILLGVAVALHPGSGVRFERSALSKGLFFAFWAAAGTALGAVLSRKGYEIANAAGQPLTGLDAAFQRIVAGTLVAGFALLLVKRHVFRVQESASPAMVVEVSRKKWNGVWPWVLGNAVMGQALGVSCMQWALQTTPTGVVLAIVATTPVMMIPATWAIDKERPTLHSLAGALIAVGGIIGLTLAR